MKDLDYYISELADPWGNSETDQSEVQSEGYRRFKFDSIIQSIGTVECQINLRLFFSELVNDIDEFGLRNFLTDCFEKIVEEYGLYTIESYIKDSETFDYTKEFIEVLKFFEMDSGANYLAKVINVPDNRMLSNWNRLTEYIKTIIDEIRTQITSNDKINRIIREYFNTAATGDLIVTILKIIEKNKIEFYMLKQETENGNDQKGRAGNKIAEN